MLGKGITLKRLYRRLESMAGSSHIDDLRAGLGYVAVKLYNGSTRVLPP